MNDKRLINGLKGVRSRFYGWAIMCFAVSLYDMFVLEGKAARIFLLIVLIGVVLGGSISSFIEGYEKEP